MASHSGVFVSLGLYPRALTETPLPEIWRQGCSKEGVFAGGRMQWAVTCNGSRVYGCAKLLRVARFHWLDELVAAKPQGCNDQVAAARHQRRVGVQVNLVLGVGDRVQRGTLLPGGRTEQGKSKMGTARRGTQQA